MANYSCGSVWRRWELHLHTPFTKKEDHYEGNGPDEKWGNFYRTINDYIGDATDPLKTICAIAITDYLSIDNYIKVRNDDCLPKCVKLLLPNVELRMKPIARDSPINIHCIFSPEIADEIEQRFFAKLKFEYKDTTYAATRAELIRLGRDYKDSNNLSGSEAYLAGLHQYIISSKVLTDIFKDDPGLRESTIIVVSNKSKDGASGTREHRDYLVGNVSQLDATRQHIYQISDMIYSASPADIKYFLGEGVDDEETVKQKCNSLMPCIHGCDAHNNEKVFEPDKKRYCWIKADPTFEGFRQLLFEPKERVRISATCPEVKQDYHVIDRVEIIGNDNFDSQHPILFNDKLTCIIGGKSTGKSLLLHNMAIALDEAQVSDKEKIVKTNVRKVPQLKIYWRDGVCSDNKDIVRKVVYIPQTYLNRLSDEKEEVTEIDSMIQDVVLLDEYAHQMHDEMKEKISNLSQMVAKIVVEIVQAFAIRKKINDEKGEVGDKKGIESEINKLENQLKQLSIEYNVTEEDTKNYQEALEGIQSLSAKVEKLDKEKENLGSLRSVLQKIDLSQKGFVLFKDPVLIAVDKVQSMADDNWLTERRQITIEIEEQINNYKTRLSESEKLVKELQPKMEGNEQINKISSDILSEKKKLMLLSKFDNSLREIQITYDEKVRMLTETITEYKEYCSVYADKVNKNFTSPTEDLEFHVRCIFRAEQFKQKILDILNKKSIGRFSAINFYKVTEEDLVQSKLTKLVEAVLKNSPETLQLTKGHTPESTLRDIFTNWFKVGYVVKMDGDSIEDMSPGKKALVLLRLIISLAESKSPILIDQPEDDLDNRSIFDELIPFIKAKKIGRQIIAVTHNANIVLGGDAELVLVANQEGKNAPNKQFRFEYRGGSIENNMPINGINGNIKNGILNLKGIQTHVCEILEGGKRAFELRRNKYRFKKPGTIKTNVIS